MATSGVLTFHACHNSGVMVSQLDAGTYDHIGFFGINGPNDAIIVQNWNDATWVVDKSGVADPAPGAWGALVNNKWIDASGCSSSGHPRQDVSFYQDNNDVLVSGTLLIWFRASGALVLSAYNAKLFAYDNTGGLYDPPPDVHVEGFEINPSGSIIDGYCVTEWSSMDGYAAGINFADHSPNTGYQADQNEHIWYCAISTRADAVGFLDSWDLTFVFQFA
jgi:hypothetical protein